MADWWNGVELWVAGLAFPLQFALVLVFLGPMCVGVAWVIDRTVDNVSAWFGTASGAEAPIGGEDTAGARTSGDTAAETDDGAAEDLVDAASH